MSRLSKNVDQVGMNLVPPDPVLGLFASLYQKNDRSAQIKFMQSIVSIVDGMRKTRFFGTGKPDTWEKLDGFLKQLMGEYVKNRITVSAGDVVILTTPQVYTEFSLSARSGRKLANFITTANLYKTKNTRITLQDFITKCEKYFGFSVDIQSEECTGDIAYIDNDGPNCKIHCLGFIKPDRLAKLSDFFLKVIYDQKATRDNRLNAIFALVFLYGSTPHVIQNKTGLMGGGAFATDFLLQYLLTSIGEKPIRKNYLTLTEIELLFLFGQDNQDAWDAPRKYYLAACNNNDSNLLFHQGDSLSLLKMMISDDFDFVALAEEHSEKKEGQFHHILFKMLTELSIEHRRVHVSNIYIPSAFAIKDPKKIMEEIARMKESILSLLPEPKEVFDEIYKKVCGVLTKASTSEESSARSTGSFIKPLLEKIQATKPSCREELLLHIELAYLSANNADNEQCLNDCIRLILTFPSLEEFMEKCRIFDINYVRTLHHKTLEILLEDAIKNKKLSVEIVGTVLSLAEGQNLLAKYWDDFKKYFTSDDEPHIENDKWDKVPRDFVNFSLEAVNFLTMLNEYSINALGKKSALQKLITVSNALIESSVLNRSFESDSFDPIEIFQLLIISHIIESQVVMDRLDAKLSALKEPEIFRLIATASAIGNLPFVLRLIELHKTNLSENAQENFTYENLPYGNNAIYPAFLSAYHYKNQDILNYCYGLADQWKKKEITTEGEEELDQVDRFCKVFVKNTLNVTFTQYIYELKRLELTLDVNLVLMWHSFRAMPPFAKENHMIFLDILINKLKNKTLTLSIDQLTELLDCVGLDKNHVSFILDLCKDKLNQINSHDFVTLMTSDSLNETQRAFIFDSNTDRLSELVTSIGDFEKLYICKSLSNDQRYHIIKSLESKFREWCEQYLDLREQLLSWDAGTPEHRDFISKATEPKVTTGSAHGHAENQHAVASASAAPQASLPETHSAGEEKKKEAIQMPAQTSADKKDVDHENSGIGSTSSIAAAAAASLFGGLSNEERQEKEASLAKKNTSNFPEKK